MAITPESDDGLDVFGFKIGDRVFGLPPHLDKSTGEPCRGDSGSVIDLSESRITAYVECGKCQYIVTVEP